jgi:acyl-CoA hydrolase
VPRLAGPVTSFQRSFIVSEQGTATIWGNDANTQAADSIEHVAHPSARDEVRDSARAWMQPLTGDPTPLVSGPLVLSH